MNPASYFFRDILLLSTLFSSLITFPMRKLEVKLDLALFFVCKRTQYYLQLPCTVIIATCAALTVFNVLRFASLLNLRQLTMTYVQFRKPSLISSKALEHKPIITPFSQNF